MRFGIGAQLFQSHHGGDSDGSNDIGRLFSQPGQALESGNLSTGQQAYAALPLDFSQSAQCRAGAVEHVERFAERLIPRG